MHRCINSSRLQLFVGLLMAAISARGQGVVEISQQPNNRLTRLTFRSDELAPSQPIVPLEAYRATTPAAVQGGLEAFRSAHAEWKVQVDQRTGLLASAVGRGIPWLPGRGNSLTAAAGGAGREPDMTVLETIARRELVLAAPLLGVD